MVIATVHQRVGRVGGFCCQVPPEPRCSLCGYSKCLVIIGICAFGPITAVPCRAKAMSLPRASILYRPQRAPLATRAAGEGLVEAPGTAPGSATLIPHHVYRHSRFPDTLNIAIFRPLGKREEGAEKRHGGPGRPPPVGPEQVHHEGLARAAAGRGQGAGSRGPTGLAPAAGTGTVRLENREGNIQITAHETVSGSHASRSRERYLQG